MGGLRAVGLSSLLLAACASSAPAERVDPAELQAMPRADEGAGAEAAEHPPPEREDLLAGCLEPGQPRPPETAPHGGVTEAIRARRADLRTCYEGLLARDPTVRGCLVVLFTVTPQGELQEIEAGRATIHDPGFTLCVTGAFTRMEVQGWDEPAPVRFTYPFVFAPET